MKAFFLNFALLFESVNNALPGLGLGVDLSVNTFRMPSDWCNFLLIDFGNLRLETLH